MLPSFPQRELEQIRSRGLFRSRHAIESAQGTNIRLQNKDVLNFCSNDYLGLAADPALKKAIKTAVDRYGFGSGSSQLVCGRSQAHQALEERIADFTERDRALVFSSGYLANMAIITSLVTSKKDLLLLDKLNHASMVDAAKASPARPRRYLHADTSSLERQLNVEAGLKLVATESVFSMDGDMAPLVEIASVCADSRAILSVDDAHGFGVFGKQGAGSLQHLALTQKEVPLMMATFGKALGGFGAFVAGPDNLIELLIQKARTLIYSTALPPAVAEANRQAVELVSKSNESREKLFSRIAYFKEAAKQLSLPLLGSNTPIQPLIIGSPELALSVSESLLQLGVLVAAIRPPTVPKDTSRLRITLSAGHTQEQIDYLLESLDAVLKEQALRQ